MAWAVSTTADVLAQINQAHGTSFELIRPLLGGLQSGAWLITDSLESRAVLKWSPEQSWAGQIQRAAPAVATARRHGYPTPAWLAVGSTSAGHGYQVQEFVVGRPHDRLTAGVATKAIDVLELQADLDPDPGRSWSTYLAGQFANQWSSTTASVSATSAAGSALVHACSEMLRPYELPSFPSSDLVHGDFRLGNVLLDQDRVSGVIDIEAIGSGTRVFDYATLLDQRHADEEAVRILVDAGSGVAGADVLAYCLVHVFLDLVLFIHRQLLHADPHARDRRVHALTTRAQLIAGMLS